MKNTKSAKAMKAAWTNARKWAKKLGGKPSLYFIYCLRDAWKWVKQQTNIQEQMVDVGEVVRETEKAVMVKVEVATFIETGTVDVWFPKSKMVGNCVPRWLINLKYDELKEKVPGLCFVYAWDN